MKPDQLLRSTLSGALSATAKVLSTTAEVTSQVARRVRPGGRTAATRPGYQPSRLREVRPQPTPDEIAKPLPETDATVSPPPTEPVPDAPSHVRSPETHAAELAEQTASEIIEEVQGLSTDELRQLYEYESDHKARKTVLKAIEKALTPESGSGGTSASGRTSPSPEPMAEAGGVPTGGGDGRPQPADARR